ncbi:hypothetical protein [uncultured Veillonella sp.]|nr:hypothetical protein [uncultured Veillonella sp.]
MTYEMELLVRHNDGIREGIAIGREEGSNIRAQKIALSMLEDKASIALISKYTGLTEQEVLDLAKEHNLL